MENNYLPKSLSYMVRELYSKRARVSFSPNTSGTAKPNDIIRVRFPTGILDLSTFSMNFQGEITGQDGNVVGTFPAGYKVFRSVKFYAGGVALGSQNQYYNRVKNAIIKSQTSTDTYYSHVLQNYDEQVSEYTDASGASTAQYVCEDNFLGLPNSSCFYDTSIFGELECELQLDDASVVKEGKGVSSANKATLSYQVNNIRFECDQIIPPPIYAQMLNVKLNQMNEPIRMPFLNIVSSKQSNTGSNRLNISSRCVDAFMVLASQSSTLNTTGYETNHFVFPSGASSVQDLHDNYALQLDIGEDQFPKNAMLNGVYAYNQSVDCWHKGSLNSYNQLGRWADGTVGLAPWKDQNHIVSWDLSLEGQGWAHPDKVCSGIDTRNMALDIVLNTKGYSNNVQWLLVALTTAVLEYNPQTRSVSVQF